MYIPTRKYLRKKAKKLCLMGQIVIESHSFLIYIDRTVKSTWMGIHCFLLYYKLNRNSCIKNSIKETLQRETQYNKPDGID